MIKPPYLKPGDTIGIVAPARKVSIGDIEIAIEIIKQQGYKVLLSDNLFGNYHQYSGTAEQRTNDFQQMLDNSNVKAIIAARGGYGSVQLIEGLNWNNFINNPKWIIGYSDITVFHSYINNILNIESIHGTMPINMKSAQSESVTSLFNLATGKTNNIVLTPHELNITGNCKGKLIGGNLSILYSLTGTSLLQNLEGCILFIEDLDEYLYHIDRIMMNLKLSGILRSIKGLVVGGMSDMNDNTIPFGFSAEQTIHNIGRELNIPICFGLQSGHVEPNIALNMGREISLNVSESQSIISYE